MVVKQPDQVRKPYRELSFPEWVTVTPCRTITNTAMLWTRHGVVHETLTQKVNN